MQKERRSTITLRGDDANQFFRDAQEELMQKPAEVAGKPDSETKAKAWERAARILETWMRDRNPEYGERHALNVHTRGTIIPHLRKQAERVRRGTKAKRERSER